MALLCAIAASMALAKSPSEFANSQSIVVVGLSMLIWGAVLCLTALLVGYGVLISVQAVLALT